MIKGKVRHWDTEHRQLAVRGVFNYLDIVSRGPYRGGRDYRAASFGFYIRVERASQWIIASRVLYASSSSRVLYTHVDDVAEESKRGMNARLISRIELSKWNLKKALANQNVNSIRLMRLKIFDTDNKIFVR